MLAYTHQGRALSAHHGDANGLAELLNIRSIAVLNLIIFLWWRISENF